MATLKATLKILPTYLLKNRALVHLLLPFLKQFSIQVHIVMEAICWSRKTINLFGFLSFSPRGGGTDY